MNRRLAGVLILLSFAIVSFCERAGAENFKPARVLVSFDLSNTPASKKQMADIVRRLAYTEFGSKAPSIETIFDNGIGVVTVPKGSERKMASKLHRKGRAQGMSAELDILVAPDFIPNDPYYNNEWHQQKIQASSAWDTSKGAPSIIIAILDTGVDPTHPDLVNHLVPGWNVFDNNSNTDDVYGHGTAVAGSAGAIINNGIGMAGVCGECGLMPMRISGLDGYASFSAMATALDFAKNHGARVANLSFGGAGGSTVLNAAQRFQAAGGVFVWSAGNAGTELTISEDPSTIYAGATDSADAKASWSNFGNFITVTAPGVGIYTTTRGGLYGSGSGTSFSAPIVSGIAGLILSVKPSLSGPQARQIIIDSADDLGTAGKDIYYGSGRVNAARAVALAQNLSGDSVPPSVSVSAPTNGSTVFGTITLSANASDNVAVSSVSFYIDGNFYVADSAAPFSATLNTLTLTNAIHTISAVATDSSNNSNSAQISVTVSNVVDTIAPLATINSPSEGAKVGNKPVKVTGSYSDNVGVSRVELLVDGVIEASSSVSPFTINLNAKRLSSGSHTLQTKAFDGAGNIGYSQVVNITK